MSGGRYIGVIDIGKTNVKYAVVDSHIWREVAVRKTANTVLPGPPYTHFDVDGIWTFLLDAMAELQREFPVHALSITTHGASGVLLKADGNLAMPVLDYEYDGPDTLSKQYDAVRPNFSETGSPRLPMGLNLGAQFFWQMQSFPDAAEHVAHIMTYPQYWAYRLTGVMANEVTSLGCHTDLWKPWTRSFSALVEGQGWTPLMVPVRIAKDVLGRLTPEIAERTGLPETTPVVCGIHDSNASLYPHLVARNAPFSVVSTGTWVICMAIGGKKTDPDPARDTLVNVNALGDPVPSARFMGGREFDMLMEGCVQHCMQDDADTVLAKKIFLLPSVENRSGPFQGREADWPNGQPTGDGQRYAAVSFYLALMTATCLDLCGAEGPIIVEGPFAKNENYRSMLCAAAGREVIASSESATGTSIGAAMLAVPSEKTPSTSSHSASALKQAAPPDALATYAEIWQAAIRRRL